MEVSHRTVASAQPPRQPELREGSAGWSSRTLSHGTHGTARGITRKEYPFVAHLLRMTGKWRLTSPASTLLAHPLKSQPGLATGGRRSMTDGAVIPQRSRGRTPRAPTADQQIARGAILRWAAPLVVAALTIVAFLPVLQNGFPCRGTTTGISSRTHTFAASVSTTFAGCGPRSTWATTSPSRG